MNDDAKYGTAWTDEELDAAVADYFSMLHCELMRKPYVKAQHSKILMQQVGRTHRSVEFKHQNISAVLDELGLPTIPGYKPKMNYQNSIFDAIDRYLTLHPEIIEPPVRQPETPKSSLDVFVDAPAVVPLKRPVPDRLKRLARKFDPVLRDHSNRALGKAGEEFVYELEIQRLSEATRGDLARKVRWVSQEDGDGAGYDIMSYDYKGTEKLLEVKTTNGSARTPFFLTRNEYELSKERIADWRVYRVHLFAEQPKIFEISPPLAAALTLSPEVWRASF